MAYEQWVVPNTNATDKTGACLRFVQRVFQNKNPQYYRSAWIAWLKAVHRSYERNIPTDVAVPVYFSHWGRYDDGLGQYGDNPNDPYYGNWGHVVVWIPGRGYLSSPTGGEGRQWFSTIEEIERAFNAKFAGWALDVGGLNVAWPKTPAPTPAPPKQKEIKVDHYHKEDETCKAGKGRELRPGESFYLHTTKGAPSSKATDLAKKPGPYSVTSHVYATGAAGDALDIMLVRQTDPNGKPSNSNHYPQRAVIDQKGIIFDNSEWKLYVGNPTKDVALYLRITAPSTNSGPVYVTRCDADAYVFTVA